jgi:hypothetical protein
LLSETAHLYCVDIEFLFWGRSDRQSAAPDPNSTSADRPSLQLAAAQQFCRFRSEADIQPLRLQNQI